MDKIIPDLRILLKHGGCDENTINALAYDIPELFGKFGYCITCGDPVNNGENEQCRACRNGK
jgi:hypothetical protein